ncbi:MAG: TonB-dependent receptor [Acidobacteriota bacterium]|nr:TonB-dependent receptor [Acidobacteriota bacterium]
MTSYSIRLSMLALMALVCLSLSVVAQTNGGTLRGTVTFETNGTIVDNASVVIVQLGRTTQTAEDGTYEFQNVPPGTYDVAARLTRFPDRTRRVEITGSGTTTLDLALSIAPIREDVTVTASSTQETTLEAIRPTTVVDAIELTERANTGLGDVLEYQPGVAKRSFGPGTTRPIIRGFDGDRVLVLQDNLPIGSVGSQSGDHGEPINVLNLERVEIVKGPATLLYGSSALGGVVNTITGRETAPAEPRGYLTGFGGTNSRQRGGAAGFEVPVGRFSIFAGGGGQRSEDYDTPLGRVLNSQTRSFDGSAGFGYYGNKFYFKTSASYDQRLYGVPFAGTFEGAGEEGEGGEGDVAQINLRMRRQNLRFNGGLRDLTNSFLSGVQLFADYTDYQHKELEGAEVGTTFNNDQFNYRGVFEQQRRGRLSGRFGFQGLNRDYLTVGAEALAPPTKQNQFAVFGLEELNFERTVVQFGGRVETNRYNPDGFQRRNFTGFSGSIGVRYPLFEGGSLVGNFSRSYRAPALEELYNFGAHIGTLTFEIGNPNLTRELSNAADFGFRYSGRRLKLEANGYYYRISDFVFLAPTGEIEDGLPVANYSQANARFAGAEIGGDFALVPNRLLLNATFDIVDAQLTKTNTPLPRIPPARGRVGLEFIAGGLRVQPEAVFASDQAEVFPLETRTPGYGVFNLRGSYTIPTPHFAHIFSVNAFNLTDNLYRNHTSFIKDLAPEIGRGVRVAYTVRFF